MTGHDDRHGHPARDADLWEPCLNDKIPAAGLTAAHVRVIYNKSVDGPVDSDAAYPDPDADYSMDVLEMTMFAKGAEMSGRWKDVDGDANGRVQLRRAAD